MIAMPKPLPKQISGMIDEEEEIGDINIDLRHFLRVLKRGRIKDLKIRIEFEGLSGQIVREINNEKGILMVIIFLRSYLLMKEDGLIGDIKVTIEYIDNTSPCSFCHSCHKHSMPFIRRKS